MARAAPEKSTHTPFIGGAGAASSRVRVCLHSAPGGSGGPAGPESSSLPHHAGHLARHGRDEGGPAPAAFLGLDEGDVAAGRQLPHRGVEVILEAAEWEHGVTNGGSDGVRAWGTKGENGDVVGEKGLGVPTWDGACRRSRRRRR